MANADAAWPGAAFLQITARTNPCSRHLWGTLARAVASICAHRARLQKLIVWLLGVYILEACAVICRKATVALPDANFLSPWCQSPSFRAQNRHFCALFAFGTPIFGHFEHKIWVFVRFWPSKPPFSGFPSTKSAFLCAFALRNPHFRAFRAQNGSSSNFVLSSYASLEDFNPKESVRSATIHTSLDTFHLVIQTLNQSIAY